MIDNLNIIRNEKMPPETPRIELQGYQKQETTVRSLDVDFYFKYWI